jgi:hypothetical protein
MSGAIIARRISKVISYLEERRATSPEKAMPADEVPYSNRWYVKRLVDKNVIRRAGDNYYLDVENARAYIAKRRMLIIGCLIVFMIVIILLMMME